MPELRQNIFNQEWVINVTERAKRPEGLATHSVVQPIPELCGKLSILSRQRKQRAAGECVFCHRVEREVEFAYAGG